MNRASVHEGGKLECERLAAACGKYGKQRLAVGRCLCRTLLKRLSVVGAERRISKVLFQVLVNVEEGVTVVASVGTSPVAQQQHDVLHFRIVVEHPSWCDGAIVVGVDKGEGVCQFARMLHGHGDDVGMATDAPCILLLYLSLKHGVVDIFTVVWPVCPQHAQVKGVDH